MGEYNYPMTLDEAIKHSKDAAEMSKGMGAEKCQKEHEQLAGWLEELKEYREKEGKAVKGFFSAITKQL